MEDFTKINFADLPLLVSHEKKVAGDFKRAKQMMEYYDFFNGSLFDRERDEKMLLNYDLYNGRWRSLESYTPNASFTVGGEEVGVKSGSKLRHYPIIDRVAKSAVSQVILDPSSAMVMDFSTDAMNERKRTKLGLIQQYLNESVVEPIRKQVTDAYLKEFGINDLYALSPEEQDQARSDIENRTGELTPKNIAKYLAEDFRPRKEYGLQLLFNDLLKEQNSRYKEVRGFEDGIITDVEAYRLWIRGNEPIFENLNPRFLDWGGTQTSEFIEDAEYAKYQQWLRHTEILNRHGLHLKRYNIKKLLELFSPFGEAAYDRPESNQVRRRFVEEIKFNPELKQADYRTQDGQQKLWEAYEKIGSAYSEGWGIRECHIAWKWDRELCYVERIDKKTGRKRGYWLGENYETSHLKGDISVRKVTVPEVWHGTKLGTSDPVYVGIEAWPYQHKSLDNPFDTKLPYYGGRYNTLGGNSESVAFIDLGKPFQYRYNVQMQRIDEYERTNIGKVLLATANMKPDDWSWDDWWTSLRVGKVAMIRTKGESPNAMDAQFFRDIDLSNMRDIGSALDALREWEDKIYMSMYFNKSKLGEASPYKGVGTNQMDTAAADRQLVRMYERHREIFERMLNGYLNVMKVAYQDHEIKKTVVLDDFSRAEIDVDFEGGSLGEAAIRVVNDAALKDKVTRFKSYVEMMIQNQMGSIRDIARVVFADTPAEILKVGDEVEARAQEAAASAQQAQEEAREKDKADRVELMGVKGEIDSKIQAQKDEASLERTYVDREKFALQFDINEDGINDAYERALLEMQQKREEEAMKLKNAREQRQVEREKIKSNERIEYKKISAMKGRKSK